MTTISFSEFAKLVGVSRAAISIAVSNGRLTAHLDEKGRKFLIQEEASDEWVNNTAHKQREKALEYDEDKAQDILEKEKFAENNPNIPKLNDSRAIREAFRARIEKIRYEELSNKVVDVEKAQREYYEMARKVRDCMTAIPDRISAQLAAETNQFKVHKKLMDEIRIALRSLIDEEELKQNG